MVNRNQLDMECSKFLQYYMNRKKVKCSSYYSLRDHFLHQKILFSLFDLLRQSLLLDARNNL